MYQMELKIMNLWENNYQKYVEKHLLTKLEAFKMIANELNIYMDIVKKKIENHKK
jgi:methanogenic corrinoid protein MtbC1